MRIAIRDIKDKIDFGIITIREDEYLAVFDRFKPLVTSQGRRTYDIGTVNAIDGGIYRFALIRAIAQGEGTAQDVARDMIEDLHPKWLLLVGIGGAVPSADFTLGDVVCATRVHDFCVRAAKEGASDSFAAAGGPMHKNVEDLLARLPGIERRLQDWNAQSLIGTIPVFEVPEAGSDRYYGSKEWQAEVRRWLAHHFNRSNEVRQPCVTSRPVASSDTLVKDSNLLSDWLTEARAVAAVEMELAGVYIAARRHDREYPILAIRGISDIVGFKRDEAWTKYACNTAAAFALALIKSGELHPLEALSGVDVKTHQALAEESQSTSIGAKTARDAFFQGVPTETEIGLAFPGLTFVGWLSRRGKSIVAKYHFSDLPFVIKKTNVGQCDVIALQQISACEISGSDWQVKASIATPLSVRVVDKWVYELHHYYAGVRIDRLITRNRFRIQGDYLGAAHNSIAFALDQLHRKGLIHRDVRPQNFLILSDGSLVLLDCSFVCRQGEIQTPVDSGIYTAPEQLEGKAVAQSDWYSLAATMYFIATGYPPSRASEQTLMQELEDIDIGAYDRPFWSYERQIYSDAGFWAAVISAELEARPKNLSEVLFSEHSRAVWFSTLVSVLDMEDLGYLVIEDSGFDVVPPSEINAKLTHTRYAQDALKESVKQHLDGHPNWVIDGNIKP